MERRAVRSGSGYEEGVGFSRAVRIGDRVLVAGTAPIGPDGHCEPDAGSQARRCFEIIDQALSGLGAAMTDVVRTRMFIVDRTDAKAVGEVHRELFGDVRPAATMVVVAGLLDEAWRVEVEAEAVVGDGA